MNNYIFLSYFLSLFFLFLGIIFLRLAYSSPKNCGLYQWMIRFIGVLPGFIGVIAGVYLHFTKGGIDGLSIMSAWLILELGSVQMLNLMKKF